MKQFFLILLFIPFLLLMYLSLQNISKLYAAGKIDSRRKFWLKYISIFIPVLGYLLVKRYKLEE